MTGLDSLSRIFRGYLRPHLPPLAALAVVFALASASSAGTAPSPDCPRAPVIYLLPLGDQVTAADLEAATAALQAFFLAEVRTLPRVPLPREAYYVPRNRYRAERLLDFSRRTNRRTPTGSWG